MVASRLECCPPFSVDPDIEILLRTNESPRLDTEIIDEKDTAALLSREYPLAPVATPKMDLSEKVSIRYPTQCFSL